MQVLNQGLIYKNDVATLLIEEWPIKIMVVAKLFLRSPISVVSVMETGKYECVKFIVNIFNENIAFINVMCDLKS